MANISALQNRIGIFGYLAVGMSLAYLMLSSNTVWAEVDVVVGRWNADYPDANTFAGILHSQEGLLGRLCGSPDMDRLIERARAETSPAVRHSIYRQIEESIARDALMLPLFHEQTYRFARPELEGVTLSYAVTAVDYSNLRIRT